VAHNWVSYHALTLSIKKKLKLAKKKEIEEH